MNNGKLIKTIFWTLLVGSYGWTTLTFFISGKANAADTKELRAKDTKIQEEYHETEKENGQKFEKIMVMLAEIQTEQKVTKELIKNGE